MIDSWRTKNESEYVWTGNLIWIRYVWTNVDIFESGKEKLQIQNNPDTCGRGLK